MAQPTLKLVEKQPNPEIEAPEMIDALRMEIRQQINQGTKIGAMAKNVGVSGQTISKLFYGQTKFPRMTTIILLAYHFGYLVYMRKR